MHRLSYISTIAADLGDIFFFIAPITAFPLVVTYSIRNGICSSPWLPFRPSFFSWDWF